MRVKLPKKQGTDKLLPFYPNPDFFIYLVFSITLVTVDV